MTRYGLLLSLLSISACSDSVSNPPATASPVTTTTAPAPDATARYRVTFEAMWSAATHPNRIPPNPHFSPLIGATHREGTLFWEEGAVATNGIEAMAELGSTTPLDDEIADAIGRGAAEHLLSGDDIALSPGSATLAFSIGIDHPYVTLVSMLAPSPDWFVGVSSLSLLESGNWVAERRIELFAYDAGTDSGTTYEARDRDTVPREPIALIDYPPVVTNGNAVPFGTFTFRRE